MPVFALYCLDKENAADLRKMTRPAHLAYLEESDVTLHLGGPLLDENDAPIGSLLIIEAANDAEAQAFADNDPYAKAGLFQSVEIKRFMFVAGELVADQG